MTVVSVFFCRDRYCRFFSLPEHIDNFPIFHTFPPCFLLRRATSLHLYRQQKNDPVAQKDRISENFFNLFQKKRRGKNNFLCAEKFSHRRLPPVASFFGLSCICAFDSSCRFFFYEHMVTDLLYSKTMRFSSILTFFAKNVGKTALFQVFCFIGFLFRSGCSPAVLIFCLFHVFLTNARLLHIACALFSIVSKFLFRLFRQAE